MIGSPRPVGLYKSRWIYSAPLKPSLLHIPYHNTTSALPRAMYGVMKNDSAALLSAYKSFTAVLAEATYVSSGLSIHGETQRILQAADDSEAVRVGGEAQLGLADDWQFMGTFCFLGILPRHLVGSESEIRKGVDDWSRSIVRPSVW
ncbi:uncharacterized [Tachysurus ichikawai]